MMPAFRPLAAALSLLIPTLATAQETPPAYDPPRVASLAEPLETASEFYSDPRFRDWAARFTSGDLDGVITATLADLQGAAPHPLASYAWAAAQWARGTLTDSQTPALPTGMAPALAQRLTLAADAMRLSRLDRHSGGDALARAALDQAAAGAPDYMTLLVSGVSSCYLDITTLCAATGEALTQAWPDDFRAGRLLGQMAGNPNPAADLPARIDADPRLSHSAAGRYAAWLVQTTGRDAATEVAALSLWAARLPGDAFVQQFLGANLSSNKYPDQGLAAYDRAIALDPFNQAAATERAETLIELWQPDAARAALESWAALALPAATRATATDRLMAEALLSAGDYGPAADTLAPALAAAPQDARLNWQMARALSALNRKAEALPHALSARDAAPGDERIVETALSLMTETGDPAGALAAWENYEETGGYSDTPVLDAVQDAALATGDRARVDQALALSAARFPDMTWLRANAAWGLNSLGDTGAAFDLLADLTGQDLMTAWSLGRLVDYGTAAGQEEALTRLLDTALARHPGRQDIWSAEVRLPGADPVATWRRAIPQAPASAFPWYQLALALQDRDDSVTEAISVLNDGLDRLTALAANRVEIARLQRLKASMIRIGVEDGDLPATRLDDGLALVEQAREGGVIGTDVHWTRYNTLLVLDRQEQAASALLDYVALAPGSEWAAKEVFHTTGSRFIDTGTKFVILDHYLRRSPRSAEFLMAAAGYHSKWGGSDLVALQLLKQARAMDPDVDTSSREATALSNLGAQKAYYRDRYDRGRYISNSARYVQWFENARAAARRDTSTILELDADHARILRMRPDGVEEELQDDPVNGRPLTRRIGAMVARFSYNRVGQLTGVRLGDGNGFEIGYADTGKPLTMGRANSLSRPDGSRILFTYDDRDQISRIDIPGRGVLEITHDDQGEILTTEVHDLAPDIDPDSAGIDLVMQLQSAMSEMRDLSNLTLETLSDLDYAEDPEVEAARAAVEAADADEEAEVTVTRDVDLGEVLLARIADRAGYLDEAEQAFTWSAQSVQDWAGEGVATDQDLADGLRAIRDLYLLHRKVRPGGLPQDLMQVWLDLVDWAQALDSEAPMVTSARDDLLRTLAAQPLQMLSDDGWLVRTDLPRPGFWDNYTLAELFPRAFSDRLRLTAVTWWNGAPALGSDRGLSLRERGHWQWYAFDPETSDLSRDVDTSAVNGQSDVLALAGDAAGRLWIATRTGLSSVTDPGDPASLLRYPDVKGEITALSPDEAGETIAVGTDQGLWRVTPATGEVVQLDPRPVRGLRALPDGWLVTGQGASWAQLPEGPVDTGSFGAASLVFDPVDSRLYAMRGDELLTNDLSQGLDPDAWTRVSGQEAISATDTPYGLAMLTLEEGEDALAVLTDHGVSLLWRRTFEHLDLPGGDRRTAALALATEGRRMAILTPAGLQVYDPERRVLLSDDRVWDMATDAGLGVTYVAMGDRIEVIDHATVAEEGTTILGYSSSRVLALTAEGDLIADDGTDIIRYARGSVTRELLFEAQQTVPPSERQGGVGDILAAADGTIWVTAGGSLFHWVAGEVTEYTIYDEANPAPFDSDWLAGLFQDETGQIYVVASNEAHLSYRGDPMNGGLFRLTEDGTFDLVPQDQQEGSWFVTSATRTDADRVVLGTAGGFSWMQDGRIHDFDLAGNDSYDAAVEAQPAMYLGTQGTQIGKDLWLFGSAGGLVVRNGASWFIPDRLNWMLPGLDYADYGSRAVHAVASDARGRIYVGTDWGLSMLDPGGAGAEAFLFSEGRAASVFSAAEEARQQELNGVLTDALPADSEAGRLAASFRQSRVQLAALEAQLAAGLASDSDRKDLDRQVTRLRQRDISLLSRLENENPVLFSMLALNPLDLQALARNLPEDTIVAQYLPTDDRLYINLVGRDISDVVEVDLDGKTLDETVRRAVRLLARQAGAAQEVEGEVRLPGGGGTATGGAQTGPSGAAQDQLLTGLLTQLYDDLLRPVEGRLPEDATLVISPTGALNYLPFAALIRDPKGERPSYAVEHFRMAVAPSLYVLDSLIAATPSLSFEHTVFGDPDGTLPGARDEAARVADLLAPDMVDLRIGADATLDALEDTVSRARFVHLAMHGKLDPKAPRNSYLLLAGGRQLTLPEIITLPLANADLVYLSACETGLGTDGLELRSLAQAFAQAGAPAVIATLWPVNDAASRLLAEEFYDARVLGDGNAASLQRAQLAALDAGGELAKPGLWSGLQVFGQP